MDAPTLPGIHHITAIAGDPQQNVDFYAGLLGLRLVKKTVNFDDPGTYHLYYGDGLGRPGSIMTFFPWPGARRGRPGAGQVGVTSFSVPRSSLDYWRDRLTAAGVHVTESSRFDETVLGFSDPDGMPIEIVGADDARDGWTGGPSAPEHAIRGFHAPTLLVSRLDPSAALLAGVMGFREMGREENRVRYATSDGAPGTTVDLVVDSSRGVPGAGTVHHIAYRTPDDAQQLAWQAELTRQGLHVTEVRDRQYFQSIYYREPNGILYEIATDSPGFAVDESPDSLGTALKLPPWLEPSRSQIERVLPPLGAPTPAVR